MRRLIEVGGAPVCQRLIERFNPACWNGQASFDHL
jgi:hypothetical protein